MLVQRLRRWPNIKPALLVAVLPRYDIARYPFSPLKWVGQIPLCRLLRGPPPWSYYSHAVRQIVDSGDPRPLMSPPNHSRKPTALTRVRLNCLSPVFINLSLELFKKFPASNELNYLYLIQLLQTCLFLFFFHLKLEKFKQYWLQVTKNIFNNKNSS